ncbi:hypothetical protein BDZ94DRAFT_1325944 [Collybia nuda]|uniref:F-box domain-containing protein n=1 Tax=Collybia nuda TaxID=64659 RepID=A0A9P6CEB1_9AGAR|nr:hypothetical protein BDZ94DRAFT_1325944 [Collybia nuda]
MVLARHRDIGYATSFPQELVDLVIGFLHEDISTLKNCTIVSRKWTYKSRIHLLRTITFDLTPSALIIRHSLDDALKNKFSLLQQILTSSPNLKEYIHSVELKNLQLQNEKEGDAYEVLASILMSLLRVERFSLNNLRWYNCTESLKGAISHLLQLSTIKHVELQAFAVRERLSLMRLLTYPTNLTFLHLKRIECRDYHRGDEMVNEKQAFAVRELKAFYVDATHCSCLFDWILAPKSSLNLGGLTTLHISDGCRPNFAERLLRLAGASLEHLELGMGYVFDSHLLNIHLSDLPRLKSLELVAESSISLIQKLFNKLDQPHPLQQISVTGATPNSGVCNWGILNSHFAQPALKQLRQVEFQIVEKDWDEDDLEMLYDQFPTLEKRDILRIREVKGKSALDHYLSSPS